MQKDDERPAQFIDEKWVNKINKVRKQHIESTKLKLKRI